MSDEFWSNFTCTIVAIGVLLALTKGCEYDHAERMEKLKRVCPETTR